MNVFSIDLPVEEFLTQYTTPPYNTKKNNYFQFRPFFEQLKPHSIGIEIGVYEGYNSLGICRFCEPKKLYLVDPYKCYDEIIENTMTQYDQDFWDVLYECAKLRLEGYPVEFIRKESLDAVNDVPSELDYVYIDGDHSVESALADIHTWYSKVKVGGLLGGHDALEPEVQQAIATWMYGHPEYNNHYNFKWNDWWIIKV